MAIAGRFLLCRGTAAHLDRKIVKGGVAASLCRMEVAGVERPMNTRSLQGDGCFAENRIDLLLPRFGRTVEGASEKPCSQLADFRDAARCNSVAMEERVHFQFVVREIDRTPAEVE